MRRACTIGLAAMLVTACGGGSGATRPEPDPVDDAVEACVPIDALPDAPEAVGPTDASGTDDDEAVDTSEVVTPACRTTSPAELATCVDADLYADDLARVARERPAFSVGLEAVRSHCQEVLEQAGYQVERQPFGDGENVLGVLPGTSRADERVLLSAHADHIADCPGADDNASGVAAVLGAARVLALSTWERTLVVACWDGEELGLEGSAAYAERARDRGETLVAVYVLDTLGYIDHAPGSQQLPPEIQLLAPAAFEEVRENGAKGDFLAVLADPGTLKAANLFAGAATAAGALTYVLKIPDALKLSDEAADLRNSDHASFWAAGYSALAASDTGPLRNPYLHCAAGPDAIATLDVAFAVGVTRGLVASAAEMLLMREAHPSP